MSQLEATDTTEKRDRPTVLSVQFTNDVRLVTSSGDRAKPIARELGRPRRGNGPESRKCSVPPSNLFVRKGEK